MTFDSFDKFSFTLVYLFSRLTGSFYYIDFEYLPVLVLFVFFNNFKGFLIRFFFVDLTYSGYGEYFELGDRDIWEAIIRSFDICFSAIMPKQMLYMTDSVNMLKWSFHYIGMIRFITYVWAIYFIRRLSLICVSISS